MPPPASFVVMLLLAAPFVGSFGGVLFRRLPEGRPVALARSECEHCGATLGALDLVPIVSVLLLRGRCRHCGEPIASYHLAAELLAPLVVGITVLWLGMDAPPAILLFGSMLGWFAVLLAAIDWRCFLLPDVLTLPLLLLGLLATGVADGPGDGLALHASAAGGGYVLFRFIGFIYRRLRGREGLGQGDAKLFAAAGAWIGPQPLAAMLLAAALLTLGAALAAGRGRVSARLAVPFGPGLAISCWLFWMWSVAGMIDAAP